MPATLSITTDMIVESIVKYYEGSTEITTAQLREWCNIQSYTYSTIRNRLVKDGYQAGRGKFNLKKAQQVAQLEESYTAPAATGAESVKTIISEVENLVPVTDDKFVPFGNFKDM